MNTAGFKRSLSVKMNFWEENEIEEEYEEKESEPKCTETKLQTYILQDQEVINRQLFNFLMSPLPEGIYLECNIFRKKVGRNKYFYVYTKEGKKFLFNAEKKNLSYTHSISAVKDNFNELIGTLNSNFLGTEFNLMNVDQLLSTITYDLNIFGIKGPRKMKVHIPGINDGQTIQIKSNNKDNLLKKEMKHDIIAFKNKMPVWSDKLQTYLLDFNKRVTRESVKNFQIIDEKGNVTLQFGRSGDNVFIMDFQYPLSPIQAFGICLTSIERKFGCQ